MSASWSYEDLAIRLEPSPEGVIARVDSPGHRPAVVPLRLPDELPDPAALPGLVEISVLRTAERGTAATTAERSRGTSLPPELAPCEELRSLGQSLFETLFSGAVRDAYQQCRGRVEAPKHRGLRLRLVLDPELEPRGWSHLPWELLYHRESRNFLGRQAETPVLRSLPVHRWYRGAVPAGPVRVLVVVASPEDRDPISIREELTELQDLEENRGQIELCLLDRPTINQVREKLLGERFDAFHFIGHAGFDAHTGEGLLFFESSRGRSLNVSAASLAECLRANPRLRLAVINACHTAVLPRRHGQDPYTGTASALLMAGLPAAVAMQFPITNHAAVAFSRAFYHALGCGQPIEAAVSEGRRAVFLDNRDSWEWITPVLYLGPGDGEALRVSQTDVDTSKGVASSTRAPQGQDQQTPERRRLLERFRDRVAGFPEPESYHYALGLQYLETGLYDDALTNLEKAKGVGRGEVELLYYLALASVKGRPIRKLTRSEVRSIEALLDAAERSGRVDAKHLYLRAALYLDFYLANGLRLDRGRVESILARARELPIQQVAVVELLDQLRDCSSHVLLELEARLET